MLYFCTDKPPAIRDETISRQYCTQFTKYCAKIKERKQQIDQRIKWLKGGSPCFPSKCSICQKFWFIFQVKTCFSFEDYYLEPYKFFSKDSRCQKIVGNFFATFVENLQQFSYIRWMYFLKRAFFSFPMRIFVPFGWS